MVVLESKKDLQVSPRLFCSSPHSHPAGNKKALCLTIVKSLHTIIALKVGTTKFSFLIYKFRDDIINSKRNLSD